MCLRCQVSGFRWERSEISGQRSGESRAAQETVWFVTIRRNCLRMVTDHSGSAMHGHCFKGTKISELSTHTAK